MADAEQVQIEENVVAQDGSEHGDDQNMTVADTPEEESESGGDAEKESMGAEDSQPYLYRSCRIPSFFIRRVVPQRGFVYKTKHF